jgi:uncharacterized repeat protein (TIGR03837 family)
LPILAANRRFAHAIALPPRAMKPTSAVQRWDVFCRVVDNFGDAAVCWRLARSLANDHGFAVRLWIDRLDVLAALQPALDAAAADQWLDAVRVCRLSSPMPCTDLPDVAIDAFGNGLPDAYAEALALRRPQALWIVLEYLSAEDWATGVHAMASPHPSLDIRRFFFCPGPGTQAGGLLREPGLVAAREAADADAGSAVRFWHALGFAPPAEGTTVVSLFGYRNPGLRGLLDAMAQGSRPVLLALAPGPLADDAATWFSAAGAVVACAAQGGPAAGTRAAAPAAATTTATTGALQARWLPFLSQRDYDRLLWASDFNFVRGEDSLVRALWAARPLCWQLYPQQADAQCPKLEAFMAATRDPDAGLLPRDGWSDLQRAWNGCGVASAGCGLQVAAAWTAVIENLPDLRHRAARLATRLAGQPDLVSRLAGFCREQLK